MPRRPSGRRRLSKYQPLAFSPFMRSIAFASTVRRKFPYPDTSFDAKFSNLCDKGKEKQLLESSDDEDSQGEVQADFEFFDPKATDFHGVKILLQNYLDEKDWDLSGFVELILDQTTVGTVVKVADDEDDALFALVTALNLARYKETKCFRELREFLLSVCLEKNVATDLELLLEKKAKDVGLLVSQRVMNLPPQLLPPLYDGLFDEVSWATEDEPTEELRGSFRFKSYILVTKIYKNPKQRSKEDICKKNVLQLSSCSFTFPMHSQLVTYQELKNYQLTGLVMVVEAQKILEFRQKLKSLIEEH